MIQDIKYHTTIPINPIEGDIYYNNIDSTNYLYQDGTWKSLTFHSDIWTDKRIVNRKRKIKNIYE